MFRNLASTSAYYINRQLETLWQIATDCVLSHRPGLSPTDTENEYSTLLAQICVGELNRLPYSKENISFFATFGTPQLKFLCNHEAVLELHIQSGHYREDLCENIESIEDFICSFRIQHHEHPLMDPSNSKINHSMDAFRANFILLDLSTATFLADLSKWTSGAPHEAKRKQGVIVTNLQAHYLPLLHKAGFHCLHALPNIGDLGCNHTLDYSLIRKAELGNVHLDRISIDAVNCALKCRWLEATMRIDELDSGHEHSLAGKLAIAVYRNVAGDGMNSWEFRASFDPPQIQALCPKEVVLYLDVQDLQASGAGYDGVFAFSGWKIAIVTDVDLTASDNQFKLDFSSARFCEDRSHFIAGIILEEPMFSNFRHAFVQHIMKRYLTTLESFRHLQIDQRILRVLAEDDSIDDTEDPPAFTERVSITNTFGFDIVTAIAQGSINNNLRTLWKLPGSCLSEWRFEELFHASFSAPKVQLLCDLADSRSNKVILYINLRQGFLTTLGSCKTPVGGENYTFSDVRVAFEITLTLKDYCNFKSHPVSDARLQEHGGVGEYVLKQIILDLSTAKFRQEHSRIASLFDKDDFRLIKAKFEALLHYITRVYFRQLKAQGQHVLYTFPVWTAARTSGLTYTPASVSFQFYPAPIDPEDGGKTAMSLTRSPGDRNMIVVCGVLQSDRRPAFPLPICPWKIRPKETMSFGTVALSRETFLDGWLLPELGHVNSRTTLVPIFEGVGEGGEVMLELVSWEKHGWNKDRLCGWSEVTPEAAGQLEFEWRNKEEWSCSHHRTSNAHNGTYSVLCDTHNTVIIPTVSTYGECDIKLNGSVDFALNFTGAEKCWMTSASAVWSASILISNDPGAGMGGLKFVHSSSFSVSETSGFSGDFQIVHPRCKDAKTLLTEKLDGVTLVERATVESFQAALGGMWPLFYSAVHGYMLCDPVFNSRGDFLLHLKSPLSDGQPKFISSNIEVRPGNHRHTTPKFQPVSIGLRDITSSGQLSESLPPTVDVSHASTGEGRSGGKGSSIKSSVAENVVEVLEAGKPSCMYDASDVVGFHASSFTNS